MRHNERQINSNQRSTVYKFFSLFSAILLSATIPGNFDDALHNDMDEMQSVQFTQHTKCCKEQPV